MKFTILTVIEVIVSIGFLIALLTVNFRLAGVQSRMVAKLNATNPPDHQHDQWGHPLFGSRWISVPLRSGQLLSEYRAKFGEDDLLHQRKRLFLSGVVVIVPLWLIAVSVWVF